MPDRRDLADLRQARNLFSKAYSNSKKDCKRGPLRKRGFGCAPR